MYIASFKRSESYKAQSYQYASTSKQILKAKVKPFLPCTHYGFNDHRPDDCRNYTECEICRSYDHSTSGHNRVINIRGGVLAESSIGVKCNTYGSTVHSTYDHYEFDHFKRGSSWQISSISKAFRVYNTRKQQIEETYHVTFNESIEAIRFTNTSVDEIGIDDSFRYPPDEFLYEDDHSRHYQVDFDISYYVIPHGRSLTELTQENHVTKVIVPNEHDVPLTEDIKDPPDIINTEETHEQNVQDDQMITQLTDSNPKESHLIVVKRILRYLNGTPTLGLYYPKYLGFDLKEYSDSDYASYNMDRKSTSCACQILGGKLVCWSAKKQQSMVMSSAEAEYVTAAGCYASILWMKSQLDPFSSTDEPEKRSLKESQMGNDLWTLDYKTFYSSTGLDYNNDKYFDHLTHGIIKKELDKISINPSYLDKTLVLKNYFPVAWRILFTFVIQVLGRNYSSTEQVNSIQQLLAYSLITGTEDPSKVTEIELTAHIIVVNNQMDLVSPPPLVAKPKKGKSQTVTSTSPKSRGPEALGALSKKRKRPTSKKPPIETKVTPPKTTKGSEQSHSDSSGTVPDPQDLERYIQFA
nr:uncharacterized mitochondrial protein AtMg00810-like [Tanacetum cinerariifolium]